MSRKTQIIGDLKECSKCNKLLPINNFNINRSTSCGLHSSCKLCLKVYYNNRSQALKDKAKESSLNCYYNRKNGVISEYKKRKELLAELNLSHAAISHIKRKYNLSLEKYINMLEKQHYKCLICGISEKDISSKLAVDHDHESGKVRGLLCNKCNSAIGLLKEDPKLLIKAAEYLNNNK